MSTPDRMPLYAALLAAMRPLASMLLRFGVGYREFADVCKTAFVQAASEEFGLRGRPTNTSRVAAMTGLTRKEVRRLREGADAADLPPVTGPNRPAEALHAWHTDPRFSEPGGMPKPLSWDGPEPSFMALVRSCAGDLPPGAIRTELCRLGAMVGTADGRLVATRRHVIPPTADLRLVEGISFGLRPLAATIAHNVGEAGQDSPRFQRVVENRRLPPERVPAIEAAVRERLIRFSEELDDYLAQEEQRSAGGQSGTVGIGLFYYEERPAAVPQVVATDTRSDSPAS